uniref:Uncharacterized protein n=1 Tax=Pediastrum duplex TaxID=3105 RepID=A0A2U8GIS5_PEDDU|nr:hypothetical protein [Pediastrum duplex]
MFGSALWFFFDASFASLASSLRERSQCGGSFRFFRFLGRASVPRCFSFADAQPKEQKAEAPKKQRAFAEREAERRSEDKVAEGFFCFGHASVRSRFFARLRRSERSQGAPKSQGTPSEDSRLNQRSKEPREAKKRTKAKKQKSQNNKAPKLYINDGTQLE